ncbi:MAG: tRNA (adenosine(37)-N6)-dimethylallyltransferase MiaA [Pseudomonadota bacterium]
MIKNSHPHIPILLIGGPTASGKSKLALSLAQKNNGVILNGDSMQTYKDLPILTAQPSTLEQQDIPHELYGILPGNHLYSVAHWQTRALNAIENAWKQGKQPIVVGGSGLYLQSLTLGLSKIPDVPESIRTWVRQHYETLGNKEFHQYLTSIDSQMSKRLHENDKQRMMRAAEVKLATSRSLAHWQKQRNHDAVKHLKCKMIVLLPPRTQLHQNSELRLNQMITNGAIEEVRALKDKNLDENLPIMKALGVNELSAYLDNKLNLQEATQQTLQATRQYIKRQSTWFCNQFPQAQFVSSYPVPHIWGVDGEQ